MIKRNIRLSIVACRAVERAKKMPKNTKVVAKMSDKHSTMFSWFLCISVIIGVFIMLMIATFVIAF